MASPPARCARRSGWWASRPASTRCGTCWASDVRVARLRALDGGGPPEYYRLEGSQAVPLNGGKARPFAPSDLLSPVTPSQIVAVVRNYADHAQELQHEV